MTSDQVGGFVIYRRSWQSCSNCSHKWESQSRAEGLQKLPPVDTKCPNCGHTPSILLREISGISSSTDLNGVSHE